MIRPAISRHFQAICLTCLIFASQIVSAQELSAANTSQYLGNGRWSWTVFIRASPNVLQKIDCVEYTLHPTFPKPIRRVCQRGDESMPFALREEGWGVFEIPIKVEFVDGHTRLIKYRLSFESAQREQSLPIETRNTARQIKPGWWAWTVFIEAPEDVLRKVRCVEYTLHPSFANPRREVCQRGVGTRAFALSESGWGTFSIKVRILLNNGSVQEQIHELRF